MTYGEHILAIKLRQIHQTQLSIVAMVKVCGCTPKKKKKIRGTITLSYRDLPNNNDFDIDKKFLQ